MKRSTSPLLFAALTVALPALGQSSLTLSGDIAAADAIYTLVPFTVPAGTAELQVDHLVSSVDADDVLDFGVWDPQGFRGWGGGNKEPVIVGALESSRSYLPGPLPAGTWNVVIGNARVATSAHYVLTVTFRAAPTLTRSADRSTYQPAVLATGSRWYAGDFHTHSLQSGDASPSLDAMATLASSLGLSFIEISDHNTDAQIGFLTATQARHPNLLLMPGVEFTTYQGHGNGIGATTYVDHRIGLNGRTVAQAIADFHQQGALFSMNHPALDLGAICIGCAWRWPVDASTLDAVEIETGGWKQDGLIFYPAPVARWDLYCGRGHHVAAIGGSDDHSAGNEKSGYSSPIGSPTTMVFASELSPRGVIAGVKAGRTVVKFQGPTDPMVEVWVGDAGIGDTVTQAHAHLTATVTGASGLDAGFRWVQNGVAQAPVGVTGDPFVQELDVTSPASGEDRWRAEVWVDGAPRTVTSHLWITAPPPAKGCGCAAADPAVLLPLVALWLRRRRAAL